MARPAGLEPATPGLEGRFYGLVESCGRGLAAIGFSCISCGRRLEDGRCLWFLGADTNDKFIYMSEALYRQFLGFELEGPSPLTSCRTRIANGSSDAALCCGVRDQ